MHGNVWEWCHDRFDSGWYAKQFSKYGSEPAPDEGGPSAGSFRCVRGGAFYLNTVNCRSACRSVVVVPATRCSHDHGFRLVCGLFVESSPCRPQ